MCIGYFMIKNGGSPIRSVSSTLQHSADKVARTADAIKNKAISSRDALAQTGQAAKETIDMVDSKITSTTKELARQIEHITTLNKTEPENKR